MNVDMNVDDLLKEIEAKQRAKRLPRAAWKMYAGLYKRVRPYGSCRLASLKQELYPFSTATVPSRKASQR